MITPIISTSRAVDQTSAQPAAPPPANSGAKAAPNTNDTVQISNAAKAMMQEATETPSQTAQEARTGDQQAIRLLAKEAAARASRT